MTRTSSESVSVEVAKARNPSDARWNASVIVYYLVTHAIAIAGLFGPKPALWLFIAAGVYVAIGLSTTLSLHRLLSHRSFQCPRWLEYLWVSIAVVTGQGSPLLWVANHRQHHADPDGPHDIHSPTRGFFYSHMGWIIDNTSTDSEAWKRLCPDIADRRYYNWLLKYRMVPQAIGIVIVGLSLGWRAVPLVFFLPVVLWMQATYCVNSVCHVPKLGSRSYDTPDFSCNVGWVAWITFGEGWHNNHHAHPRSAVYGERIAQVDVAGWILRVLAKVGLVWNLRETTREIPS